jgi:hypothetical protein
MNRKAISALVIAAAAAGSAFAETPTVVNDNFVSTKSRAEVQAELFAFRKAGVNPWSIQYNPLAQFRSTADRQQVTAAYIAERDAVAAIGSEDSGSEYFAQGPRTVRSETLAGQPQRAQ